MTMDAQTIAQVIASSLNIAATLLPELEKIRNASSEPAELEAVYLDLVKRSNGIADHLRQG